MKTQYLILQEIRHRFGNFLLILSSIAVASGTLVAVILLLNQAQAESQNVLKKKRAKLSAKLVAHEEQVKQSGKELEDAARKITKGLGFNVKILPEDQDLNELNTSGSPSKTMPESKVKDLSESKVVTINHLLPMVMKKIEWEEKENLPVILAGIRGEVPFLHRAMKKPLRDQVEKGTLELGYLVHTKLGLKVGDQVTLKGREFTIAKVHPQLRGDLDDSTVWMHLEEAQELLEMQNLIHMILALGCNCATIDRIGEIRAELKEIIPGTQIIEYESKALARAETRNKAKREAEESLQREKQLGAEMLQQEERSQQQLNQQLEEKSNWLAILVLLGSGIWIALLVWWNVKHRLSEIAILRTLGVKSSQILWLFLGKSLVASLLGGLLGCGIAFLLFGGVSLSHPDSSGIHPLFQHQTALILGLVTAPILALIASWIPSLLAAQQDPATIFQSSE